MSFLVARVRLSAACYAYLDIVRGETIVVVMQETLSIEEKDGYLSFTYRGELELGPLIELGQTLNEYGRAKGHRRILLDLRESKGDIGITDRYYQGAAMSEYWDRSIHLAVVLHPDIILPDLFWVNVTRNRGIMTGAFLEIEYAVAWLLGGESSAAKPPTT